MGFPGGSDGNEYRRPSIQETWLWSMGWEDPLEEEMATTPVFLPEKSYGQGSLAGYSSKGCKESDMTEHTCARAHTHTHTHTLSNSIWQRWGEPPVVVSLPWLHYVSHSSVLADWTFSCCLWKANSSDVNRLCHREPRASVLQPKGTGFWQQPHEPGRGLGFRKVVAQVTSWVQPVRPQANDPTEPWTPD